MTTYFTTKRILILLSAGLLLLLAGCNNTADPNAPSGDITLVFRGVFWDKTVMDPLINEYQQQNPKITIDYANRWSTGNAETAASLYRDDLLRVVKSTNTSEIPDLFMVENTWVGEFANYSAPAPSSVTDAAAVKSSFYPAVAQDFARNDKVVGLPMWIDTLAIIYNKQLLAAQSLSAPPTSLVDFKTKATQLTTRSSGVITSAGFAAGTSNNVGFGPEYLNLLFLQNGVKMLDTNGNPIFAASNDASTAVQYYKDFATSIGSWNSTQKYDAIAFLEGKLAMMVSTSWRLNQILEFNELYDLNLQIEVAPMPQIPNQPVINWATYWGVMVSNNRPNSTEAWKFLKWLTLPEQLRKLRTSELAARKNFGILYPRSDMQSDADIKSNKYLQVFNSQLPTAQSWYMVSGFQVRREFLSLIDAGSQQSNIAATQSRVRDIISGK